MKIKIQKGFSLAEVLISLTVVSILIAAAAPVLTKQAVGDNIWKWTQGHSVKNGTSFDGNNVVIGRATVPIESEISDFDKDGFNYFNYYPNEDTLYYRKDFVPEANKALFKDNGRLLSKLSIIKPMSKFRVTNVRTPFVDSHIAFYNVVNDETEYAGRLTLDARNIALGIGTMQSKTLIGQSSTTTNFSTALGHYSFTRGVPNNAVSLGYGNVPTSTGVKGVAIGYHVDTTGADNTLIMNDITRDYRTSGGKNLIIGNYLYNNGVATLTSFGNQNILIGNNAGLGRSNWTGTITNRLAIGHVEPGATDETGIELIQGHLKKDSSDSKKIIINGDFVVKSSDSRDRRTLLKIDGTGIPINPGSVAIASKLDNVTGPPRCEGAEICIGRFQNIPFVDCGILAPKINPKTEYDIYIKSMSAGEHHSRVTTKIPYLRAALLYLDRYKDTKGSLINFIDKRNAIFGMYFPGLSAAFGDFTDFFLSLIGLSDERLKNVYGDSTAGLKEINALKIKNYTYKADKIKTPHVGVIAQELQKIFPNSIVKGDDGYLSIKQEEMFYGLIKSIQELSNKNNTVLDKIAMTEEKIEYTEKQNKLVDQENKLLERQNREFEKRIAKLQKKDKK